MIVSAKGEEKFNRYLKLFLKEFCISHKELKFENLYKKLLEEFPDINISATNEEKKLF